MQKRFLSVTACAAVACVLGSTPATAGVLPKSYRIIALPGTAAADIDKRGLVAGYGGLAGSTSAMVFDHGHGTATTLATPSGAQQAQAASLNDHGVVVGWADFPGVTFRRAVIWSDGIPALPGTLPGQPTTDSTLATHVNSHGQVTGQEWSFNPALSQAFLVTGGTMAAIPGPDGTTALSANAVNEAGHVTGAASFSANASHAYLYRRGESIDLGAFGGQNATSAGNAVNNFDEVVGQSTHGVGSSPTAFTWQHGKMTDLGVLMPGHGSVARDVNDDGIVVGEYFADSGGLVREAFVCDGVRMVPLRTLLDASGAGWIVESATAINANGDIVGYGSFNNVAQAFKAKPQD